MGAVDKTDFSMPCCKNDQRPEALAGGRRVALKGLAVAGLGLTLLPWAEATESAPAEAAVAPSLVRRADGLYLSARVPMDISSAMEDVLRKGVPLYFLWQIDIYQHRWYWADKVVASATRTVRLAYQPLTRHWRLSYGSGGPSSTGLQYALSQSYESLTDALAAAGKVNSWKVADAARWAPDNGQRAELRFSLDLTQLPRPFQLSLFNQGGWNVTYQKTLAVPDKLSVEAEVDSNAAPEEKVDAPR